jgi:hypothetical protein
MGSIPDFKRIRTEDFSDEMREAIDKIAFSMNPFADQIIDILNKGIDFTNLNQEIIRLSKVSVSSSGIPTKTVKFSSNLSTTVQGIMCVSVSNVTDGAYPTGAPFISWTQKSRLVKIENITGLEANKEYNINLLTLG